MYVVPKGLADEWQGFGQQRLQTQEFVARCVQTPSDGLPLAAAQGATPADFQPQSTEELFEPWAWVALQSWVKKQLDFLKDIRKRGTDAVRQSNETLALGSEALSSAGRKGDMVGLSGDQADTVGPRARRRLAHQLRAFSRGRRSLGCR